MACSCLGRFLLRGATAEKWGDHQKKNFSINDSVEALIPLKEVHQGLLKLHAHLEGIPETTEIQFFSIQLTEVDQLARSAKT